MLASLESVAGNLNLGEIPVANAAPSEPGVQRYSRGCAALYVHTNAEGRNRE